VSSRAWCTALRAQEQSIRGLGPALHVRRLGLDLQSLKACRGSAEAITANEPIEHGSSLGLVADLLGEAISCASAGEYPSCRVAFSTLTLCEMFFEVHRICTCTLHVNVQCMHLIDVRLALSWRYGNHALCQSIACAGQ
jgi:hypothetical protein